MQMLTQITAEADAIATAATYTDAEADAYAADALPTYRQAEADSARNALARHS